MFFAWQAYRRAKAQEIFVQLQMIKLRLELAELEAKAARERAETKVTKSLTKTHVQTVYIVLEVPSL